MARSQTSLLKTGFSYESKPRIRLHVPEISASLDMMSVMSESEGPDSNICDSETNYGNLMRFDGRAKSVYVDPIASQATLSTPSRRTIPTVFTVKRATLPL